MKYIVGIDEVGRGPLAGPVTICVIACDIKLYTKLKKNRQLPPLGKDSKKLSQFNRQKYARTLKAIIQGLPLDKKYIGLAYVVVNVSNKIIDEKGISFAIKKAISQGIKKLRLNPKNCQILLDGGLKAPKEFKKQKTIIKGDEREKIIAWASILAKVTRDALMCRLAKKYSQYGFEIHKGYGTLNHRKYIKKYGLSNIHRKSFCRNI
nr:ribonuclease HII [Candidatus Zambryskibacteria bacterium]